MPAKYQPLADYLAGLPPETTSTTLALTDIAAILGAPLPTGARGRAFWANRSPGWDAAPQARAWLAAGWRVARFDRQPEMVTFTRADSAARPINGSG